MKQTAEILTNIAAINKAARDARKICTDIVRQTSHKPYYGKRGAAAVYASEDRSDTQRQTIAEALLHLQCANDLLVDVAQNGGATQTKLHELIRENYNFGKGQIIEIEDTPEIASISEKITLQK